VATKNPSELKNPGYEIFIGMLSLLSIFNIVLVYAFVTDQYLQQILQTMNMLLTGIFMMDFVYRFATAPEKGRYFFRGLGWADLLSSLPFVQFKVFRVFRLVKVYRLLHDYGPKNVARALIKDRAGSALLTLLLAGILVLEFGSLAILRVEEYAPDSNITNASDALWYVIVTISTVGYGDVFPTTNVGRLIGALIIVVGVGIFGTFTGYLANLFLAPRRAKRRAADSDSVSDKLAQLKQQMTDQLEEIDELERLVMGQAESESAVSG